MTVTIKNTNENYGDPTEWTAETLEAAVAEMQSDLRQCGPDYVDTVVSDDDYDIIEHLPGYRYEPRQLYELQGDAYVHCYACKSSLTITEAINEYEAKFEDCE